ncbi:MAG: DNA-directed RNA polymerase subunit omega [Bacteroidales bacterium]|nr:DNA-directed RNA polymerase subunit omega [Bacteroidales bacterium]
MKKSSESKVKQQKETADSKKSKAPVTTITRNLDQLYGPTGNIYETVAIVAKRANQISVETKQELSHKLEEFANVTDNLEEVFENREQIEISRFYEKLPKPTLTALQEYLDHEVYYRNPATGIEATKS